MLYLIFICSSWTGGVRASILNDSLAIEKFDDNGFTNDFELRSFVKSDKQEINFYARHRMITERGGGKDRWDELTFNIQYLHYLLKDNDFVLMFGPHLEVALGGNLGGSKIQNFVHHLINARTIESGDLQWEYPKKNTIGFIPGITLSGIRNLAYGFFVRASLLAQFTIGNTGFNKFYGSTGIVWKLKSDFMFVPQISLDVDTMILNTPDGNLTISGGYVVNRFLFIPKLEIAIVGNNWSVGYGEKWNEGGSGHSIGFAFVEVRQ